MTPATKPRTRLGSDRIAAGSGRQRLALSGADLLARAIDVSRVVPYQGTGRGWAASHASNASGDSTA
jgi:hypothetical protein